MPIRLLSTALMLSTLSVATASAGDCWRCYPGQSCYPVAAGLSYDDSGVIYNRSACGGYGAMISARRAREIRALFPPPPPHYRLDLWSGGITLQSPW
jgi:hypothetical protein